MGSLDVSLVGLLSITCLDDAAGLVPFADGAPAAAGVRKYRLRLYLCDVAGAAKMCNDLSPCPFAEPLRWFCWDHWAPDRSMSTPRGRHVLRLSQNRIGSTLGEP